METEGFGTNMAEKHEYIRIKCTDIHSECLENVKSVVC